MAQSYLNAHLLRVLRQRVLVRDADRKRLVRVNHRQLELGREAPLRVAIVLAAGGGGGKG